MIGHPESVKRRARGKARPTQEQLSFRAGLSRPYISQLGSNLKSPTVITLFRICDPGEIAPIPPVSIYLQLLQDPPRG
jgi:transcriptional regulator with XRE-family HTH domain